MRQLGVDRVLEEQPTVPIVKLLGIVMMRLDPTGWGFVGV
jgi:hypothetical protein